MAKKHGRGILKFANGDSYNGEWNDDKRSGHGIYQFATGNRYKGGWKDNVQYGRGVMMYRNGDSCEGDWRGKRLLGTGKGCVEGKSRYQGRKVKCYWDGKKVIVTNKR